MSLQLILSVAFIFTSSFILAANYIRMTARNAPADLRFGILATGGGAVMIVAAGLLWSTFGDFVVVLGIQSIVALSIGGFRLMRHFRQSEFQQR